jgi:hypothetical protein
MRANRYAVLLACAALFSMIGCTVFSAGPYVVELRYDPSATPTPLPSAIPPTPNPTAPATIAGDWAVTNLTINMPNGQLACDASTFISFNITNVGSGPTPEIEARVLQIGPSRMQLFSEAFAPIPALEAGASHFVEVSLPLHTTPNNQYMIRALVDFPNAINEPIEPNNEQNTSIEVTCGASPNLRVSGLGFVGVNCTGDTEIRFTVVNDGSADAPGSAVYISVVDTEIISVPMVPALASGVSSSGSTLLPLHTLPDGNYVLRAKADASLTIFEGNESDNITETSITVACQAGPTVVATSGIRPTAEVFPTATVDVNAADLVVTALTATGTGVNPRCGENTRVDFMVVNQGVGAAAANVIYIADYNEFVITSDAYYGIPPLQAGESYSGSVNIVVGPPANVVHLLQAQVDPDFTINEIDKTNNIMSINYNVDDAGGCP